MLTTARRTRHNYASHDYKPEDIQPLYDNLLVRRIYDAPTSPIIDPGVHRTLDGRWLKNSDEGPRKGVIVAIGQGDKRKRSEGRVSMDVKVGDKIIYARFESTHIKLGEDLLTFVHEADVMAVIEP